MSRKERNAKKGRKSTIRTTSTHRSISSRTAHNSADASSSNSRSLFNVATALGGRENAAENKVTLRLFQHLECSSSENDDDQLCLAASSSSSSQHCRARRQGKTRERVQVAARRWHVPHQSRTWPTWRAASIGCAHIVAPRVVLVGVLNP